MRLFPAILANLFLAVAAIGFGSLLIPLIPRAFSRLDRAVLTFLGGLGLLGTVLFCVGQIWFTRTATVLILAVGVLLSFRPLARIVRESHSALANVHVPGLPAAIVSLILLVTAVGGLALPVGDLNDDAIAYHFSGPKVWLREGIVRAVPDEVLTFFPVVVETQYAALMSVGGQRAPGFYAVIGMGALLLTTASLALRLGLDPTGAWWAMALVATMPAVYRGTYGGFLDGLFACFVLAAARLAFDADEPSCFLLFGIFCGISMGTKYTGIMAWGLLVFCSFVFSTWLKHRNVFFVSKWLVTSCVAAAAVASPFYLRNWILYGCPIYPPPPVLLKYFSPHNLSPAVMQELVRNVRETGRGVGGGLVGFLLLPFRLTYHTADFRGAGGIGLTPFALGPFGAIARRRDAFSMGILAFAILQSAAWFVTAQVSRYLILVYVIGAIFGVLGWKYAENFTSRTSRVLPAVAVGISILYGLWMMLPERKEDLRAAVSSSFEARRIQRERALAASFDYINHERSIQKVLVLDPGVSTYYLDKPYIKPFGRWGEQTLGVASVPQVLALLPVLQATHILDIKNGSFALPEHPAGLTLVFEQDDQRIYRID